jgi:hypothetical protein
VTAPVGFVRELTILHTAADTLEQHPRIDPVAFLRGWAERLEQIEKEDRP